MEEPVPVLTENNTQPDQGFYCLLWKTLNPVTDKKHKKHKKRESSSAPETDTPNGVTKEKRKSKKSGSERNSLKESEGTPTVNGKTEKKKKKEKK